MIKRILIGDDSPIGLKILKKTLEGNNFEVCGMAQNGKEAVEFFEKLNPDLVFMDITMPELDGVEAARIIFENRKDANIIMLTAMGDDEILERAKQVGITQFINKPFNDYKIISAIAKF